jgi:hypothetical protein
MRLMLAGEHGGDPIEMMKAFAPVQAEGGTGTTPQAGQLICGPHHAKCQSHSASIGKRKATQNLLGVTKFDQAFAMRIWHSVA